MVTGIKRGWDQRQHALLKAVCGARAILVVAAASIPVSGCGSSDPLGPSTGSSRILQQCEIQQSGDVGDGYLIDECRVGSGPLGLTYGPDGNIWFGLSAAIGRLTPNGVYTEFTEGLSADSAVINYITAGPDGNLWFTATGAATGRIGRITPDGVITEFDLVPGYLTYEIVKGNDGNLWFTAQNYSASSNDQLHSYVGRFSTEDPPGTLTTWEVSSVASGITNGPDGNVWFIQIPRQSDNGGGGIGWIDIGSGEYTLYPFPADMPQTGDTGFAATTAEITTGPDGNLWFTGESARFIGRFSPANNGFAFFSDGLTPETHLTYLQPGPDGNVYVIDHFGANPFLFFRVTPLGEITPIRGLVHQDVEDDGTVNSSRAEFGGDGGYYMIRDPDGNLWFSLTFVNRIGRLEIPH